MSSSSAAAWRASTRPASWPRRGQAVTLVEAHTLGWGASTRNGGIVHAGYKWGPRALLKRYGDDLGRALYRETLDSYALVKRLIADEAIECDFREVGHRRAGLRAFPRPRPRARPRQPRLGRGRSPTVVPRERIREEIGSDVYYGGLVVPSSGLVHPGRYFAGLAAAADRAGADLHEGVRATAIRQAGRRPVRRRDRARRDPGPGRVRGHERLHGRDRARRFAAG